MIVPLLVLGTGLSACGRDTGVAEQVMEAKQAAAQAKAAQLAAERAAERLSRQPPAPEATVVEQEPDAGGDVRPDVDTESGFNEDDAQPQG